MTAKAGAKRRNASRKTRAATPLPESAEVYWRPLKLEGISKTVETLLAAHEYADPDKRTAIDPRELGDMALTVVDEAAKMFVALAGWALSYQVGQSVARGALPIDPLQFERIGAALMNGEQLDPQQGLTPERYRAALAETLRCLTIDQGNGSLRIRLLSLMARELDELNEGFPSEVYQHTPTGNHGRAFQKQQLETRAVQWVHYLKGQGVAVGEAQARVGDAFGVSVPSLDKWPARLRIKIGARVFNRLLEGARRAGLNKSGGSVADEPGSPENQLAGRFAEYARRRSPADDGKHYRRILADTPKATSRKQVRTRRPAATKAAREPR